METQTYYGLASKKTGELLHIKEEVNTNGYACGATRVTFTTDEDDPEYLVDNRVAVEKAKLFNTPWYNSSREHPGHGSLDLNEYRVVKITKTVQVEELTPLPEIRVFGKELRGVFSHPTDRNLTRVVLEGYAQVNVGEFFWRDGKSTPGEVIEIVHLENYLEVTLRPSLTFLIDNQGI